MCGIRRLQPWVPINGPLPTGQDLCDRALAVRGTNPPVTYRDETETLRAQVEKLEGELATANEQVARLQLQTLNAKLTTLRPDQAKYIGVPLEGPYKTDHYRY